MVTWYQIFVLLLPCCSLYNWLLFCPDHLLHQILIASHVLLGGYITSYTSLSTRNDGKKERPNQDLTPAWVRNWKGAWKKALSDLWSIAILSFQITLYLLERIRGNLTLQKHSLRTLFHAPLQLLYNPPKVWFLLLWWWYLQQASKRKEVITCTVSLSTLSSSSGVRVGRVSSDSPLSETLCSDNLFS